jgi:hypothetical protein
MSPCSKWCDLESRDWALISHHQGFELELPSLQYQRNIFPLFINYSLNYFMIRTNKTKQRKKGG